MTGVPMFALGLCALVMRQTNIFWVAVFFAGLHAVHHVKSINQSRSDESVEMLVALEAIHDPPISKAYLEGMLYEADQEPFTNVQRLYQNCRFFGHRSNERHPFACAEPMAISRNASLILNFCTHQWWRSAR